MYLQIVKKIMCEMYFASLNKNILVINNTIIKMQKEGECKLPKRISGQHSNTFQEYRIQANYYAVHLLQNIQAIYVYKVVYNPFISGDNIKLKYQVLNNGLQTIKSFIPNPVITGANIYSLKSSITEEQEIQVNEYKVKIKLVKIIEVNQNPKTLLMFLNNGLRNMFRKIGYEQICRTRKFFNLNNPQNVDSDLKLFSGYKANFMLLQKGIYLRVDTAKKIVRNESVLDFINSIYMKNSNKDRDEKRIILKNMLLGQIIMTNYGKSRYVKVIDILFQTVDDYKLNEKDITLRQYYETKYNLKIVYAKQPLLQAQSRSKKQVMKTILIPELCLMTGIPQNFDEFKRKKISQATIRSPGDKRGEIEDFMKQAQETNDLRSLSKLGIEIDQKLNEIRARVIPFPKLILGSNKSVETGRETNFQLYREPIYDPKNSIRCGIFTTQNVDLSTLEETFKNTAKNLNVKFQYTIYTTQEYDKHRILNSYFIEIENAKKKNGINICLIVIPQFLKHGYNDIKKQCLNKLNIVSQCILDATLRKKNLQSIATKVLLQMIAKCGNILWVPVGTSRIENAMIMAFDTSKGQTKNCIACCATINNTFSQYHNLFSTYTNNSDKFNQMMKLSFEIINYYFKKNSFPPKQVLIFHNSCTGDQIKSFIDFFINTLFKQLKNTFSVNMVPKISLIMVNTKTNQRFFITDRNGTRNVNAGTIIANDIVSQNYQFYLVSQGTNRGSTVPNHYKVIFSNSLMQQGLLHELIFSQCFNYVNWTGSIKIPGILQYAKKCAKFSSDVLDGTSVNQELESRLYFV